MKTMTTSHGPQGQIQGFPKGGVETRDTNARGGGGAVLDPTRKAGRGCCPFKARYEKRGRGRGCLAEEGALPYMKGGVATPKPPPPPGSASGPGMFPVQRRPDLISTLVVDQ